MPQITAIKKQKYKKDRVNIYLDGEFGFGIDLENLLKFNLRVEKELTQDEIENILEEAEYKDIRDKLLNYATLRPRSEKEIDEWLYKKQVHESLHDRLKNKLKRLELLDDEKFAKWWVGQRLEFKHRSQRELIQELRKKGIPKDIIDQTIGGSVNKEYEKNATAKLLEKRSYRWKGKKDPKTKKKMIDYLIRKGFGWEVVKETVDELLGD